MTEEKSRKGIERSLAEVAEFFSRKTPHEVSFADADNHDYEISKLFQQWQKKFPDKPFEQQFPFFDKMWEELATWNAQDDWNREKCERIIQLAKKHLESQQ